MSGNNRACVGLLIATICNLAPTTSVAADIFGRGDHPAVQQAAQSTAHVPAIAVRLVQFAVEVQSALFHRMAIAITAGAREHVIWTWSAVLCAALLYGILHAFGPGHGKSVIAGYLGSSGATRRQAVMLCVWSATAQSLSAIGIVFSGMFLLRLNGNELMARVAWMESLSYAVLCGCALLALWTILTGRDCCDVRSRVRLPVNATHGKTDVEEAYLGHKLATGNRTMRRGSGMKWATRKAIALGFAAGMRPCTGAVLIAIVAIASDQPALGVAAALMMGAGVAVTLTVLGGVSLGVNRMFSSLLSVFAANVLTAYRVLASIGALAIALYSAAACLALYIGWMTPTLT